ncbi:MAG: metallophosphoesterase [Planctomycetota bacterium]|nr:metallophosphoesterase [Planctomycetota bacterium]
MAIIRFLCVSDLHGELPPETDESGVAAWLIAGDVAGPDGRAKQFLAWAGERKAPVLAVRGNHDVDLTTVQMRWHKLDISGRAKAIVPGLWVVGIGWSSHEDAATLPQPCHLEIRSHMARRMLRNEAQPDDAIVLLTHYPPALPGLSFAGEYACIGKLVDDLRPLVVIAGHDHSRHSDRFLYAGPKGRSLIVFPGPGGGTIDLDLKQWAARFTPWLPPAGG